MDKALWSLVQPLLDKAIDMPVEERTAWLARLRDESPTIADELQRLLAREGTLDRRGFLDTPTSLDSLVGRVLDGTATTHQRTQLETALAPNYVLQAEVGRGGMATVYRARDTRHARDVAIKVIRPDAASVLGAERFLAEIRLTANLTHPNILPLLDSGQAGGVLYYVMPFIEGETLRARMRREGALPVEDVRRLLRSVLEALAHAHGKGLVHRDIKPDNVLLADRQAWVADFGIAKAAANSTTSAHAATSVGVALGSPGYMAPEQIEGSTVIDGRTDLYAVGAMAWEMLAGRPVFTGESMQQLFMRHLTTAPEAIGVVRPEIPSELATLVMDCLVKATAHRPASARELLARLDAIDSASGPHTPVRRRSWPIGVALAGLAATLVAGVSWYRSRSTVEPREYRQLTSVSNVAAFATSPTTGELVYSSDELDSVRVWSARPGDPLPRLVAGRVREPDEVGVDYLTWSPDGTQLLLGGFVKQQSRSTIRSIAGDRQAPHWFARWSPDSRQLAGWQPLWKAISAVTVTNPQAAKVVKLRTSWSYLHDVAWDPVDPVFWLVTSNDTSGRYQIWSIAHNDSIPVEAHADTVPLGSLWFNGRDMYFARANRSLIDILALRDARHGRRTSATPVVVGVDMGIVALENPWNKAKVFEVADSGRRVTFLRSVTRSVALVFERDGGTWRPLWQSAASTSTWGVPRLSRDGKLHYRFEFSGDSSALVLTTLETKRSRVVFQRRGQAFNPVLSPDQERLSYCVEARGRTELHLVTLASGTSRRVETSALLGSNCETEWTDDHTVVINGDRNQLFVRIDVESGAPRPFDMGAQVPGIVSSPSLSPDGRWVAFGWNRWTAANPDWGTWRVRADGSGEIQRLDGAIYPTGWSRDGTTVLGPTAENGQVLGVASASRAASTPVALPPECARDASPRTDASGSRLACVQFTTLADVWEAARARR